MSTGVRESTRSTPAARALALDNLNDPGNARHVQDMDELHDALRYAQEHPDDAELRSAVAELYLARNNHKLASDFQLPPWNNWQSDKVQQGAKSTVLHESKGTWVMEASCWAALALRGR